MSKVNIKGAVKWADDIWGPKPKPFAVDVNVGKIEDAPKNTLLETDFTKADDTKPLTSAEALGQTYKRGDTEKRIADRTAASKNKFNNDFIARTIEAIKKPQIRNRWNPDIQNKNFHLADDWKKISNKDTYFDRGYVMSKLLEHDYGTGRTTRPKTT